MFQLLLVRRSELVPGVYQGITRLLRHFLIRDNEWKRSQNVVDRTENVRSVRGSWVWSLIKNNKNGCNEAMESEFAAIKTVSGPSIIR